MKLLAGTAGGKCSNLWSSKMRSPRGKKKSKNKNTNFYFIRVFHVLWEISSCVRVNTESIITATILNKDNSVNIIETLLSSSVELLITVL